MSDIQISANIPLPILHAQNGRRAFASEQERLEIQRLRGRESQRKRRNDPKELAKDAAAMRTKYQKDIEVSRTKMREAARKYSSKNKLKLAESKRKWLSKQIPTYSKNVNLKTKYGITLEQWNLLFESQDLCCAICKASEPGNKRTKWHTDHCHATGKVRGILCHHCNLTVGHAKDDIERLQNIISYLAGAL